MAPARRRDFAVVVLIAALAAAVMATGPAVHWLRGPSLDLLYPLRDALFDAAAPPSQVAIVAIDEETYRRPPFSELPQAAWPPLLAPVLDAVAGPAAAVGLDIVYSTTLENVQRGFERDFLLALRHAARQNKLVLGKLQHSAQPILPHPAQQIAAGGAGNVRALNLFEDPDGIIRRLPLVFDTAAGRETGFAAELAQRKAALTLQDDGAGVWRFGARALATDAAGNLLLNFDTRPGAVPTYALADLQACAAAGRSEYFAEQFAGRVVIFAVVLDVEDRRLTAMRHVVAPDGSRPPPRCHSPAPPPNPHARDSMPGVYIHATAIDNLLAARELREWPATAVFAAALAVTLLAGLLVFRLPLLSGLLAAGGLALLLPLAAAALLQGGVLVPWLTLLAALLLTLGAILAYRFTVADRDRRLIGRLFSLYLPTAVIDRMVAAGRRPELGGEERSVTVLFSDIAGFTAISEACDPAQLVSGLNEYFSAMTAIIEAEGGFVDKYIGDAIVAVFGAPLDDPGHAAHGLRAALQMRDTLAREPDRFAIAGLPLRTRIGLNTGTVLIGNIGSPRRFNYTAIGDAVNLAARLEGANKAYGTAVLVSESTMAAAGDAILARPIDTVRVVGRRQPVRIFEPLALHEQGGDLQRRQAAAFVAAQAALAGRDPGAARAALQALPDGDAAVQAFLRRLDRLDAAATVWPPVTDLSEK